MDFARPKAVREPFTEFVFSSLYVMSKSFMHEELVHLRDELEIAELIRSARPEIVYRSSTLESHLQDQQRKIRHEMRLLQLEREKLEQSHFLVMRDYSRQIRETREQIESRRAQVELLDQQAGAECQQILKTKRTALKAEARQHKRTLDALNERNDDVQNRLSDFRSQASEIQQLQQEKREKLEGVVQDIADEIERETIRRRQLLQTDEDLSNELVQLREKLKGASSRISSAQRKLNLVASDYRRMKDDYRDLQQAF
jgi:archaellum component FlaC